MNKATIAIFSAALGGAVGSAVTYYVVDSKRRRVYEDWANEEIDKVREHYAILRKEGEYDILAAVSNEEKEENRVMRTNAERMTHDLGYASVEDLEDDADDTDESDEGSRDIFDMGVPASVMIERDPDNPYVITEDEYFNNDEFEKETLTYYEVDDTLCDSRNIMIDRIEQTVGTKNLHGFKRNKKALKNSLYIRNEKHDTDYEVIMIEGSYANIVLELDDETLGYKEPKQRPRKMKRDDH